MHDWDATLIRPESPPDLQRAVLARIAGGASSDRILTELCRSVESAFGRGVCTLLVLDSEQGTLSLRAGPSVPLEFGTCLAGIAPGPLAGSCAAAAYTREVVLVEDTLLDPRWEGLRDLAVEMNIRSCWSTPILAPEKRVLGTFAVSMPEVGLPSADELEFLTTAGHLAGIVLLREESDRRLREKEQLLRGVLESMGDPVVVRDLEGRVLLANSAACAVVDADPESIVGKRGEDLFRCPGIAEQDALSERQVIESRRGLEYDVPLGEGDERRHYHVRKNPLVLEGGKVEGVISILRDVTELKQREEAVRHAQKIESLGVLAGGVAHDFNNILTGVLGNTELALADASAGSQLERFLREIHSGARRAAGLTSQMLSYAGRSETRKRVVSLPSLVEEVAALIASSISHRAELRFDIEPDLPNVEGDPDQVRQVVMNLLINASEALGSAPGEIAVTIRRCTEPRRAGMILTPEPIGGDGLVELLVADSGCGMGDAVLDRIFDPFYSTKFAGRGLGLAAVRGIVRGHGGGLAVLSAPGEGTRFSVFWPATRRKDVGEEIGVEAVDWRGGGRVLVADDEPSIREFCRRVLERSGFEVVLASDAARAVEVMHENGADIVLVVLDLTTPRMSAARAVREIESLRPDVPFLVISGFSESAARAELDQAGCAAFLQKPFGAAELVQSVRGLLEAVAAT